MIKLADVIERYVMLAKNLISGTLNRTVFLKLRPLYLRSALSREVLTVEKK